MHPSCMGRRHDDLWSKEVVDAIEPYIETALQGKAGRMSRLELHINRSGSLDETYWDALLTPCLGPNGTPIAVLNTLSECSKNVRGERRRATIYHIRDKISTATTLSDVWSKFMEGLSSAKIDVPWAAFYSAEHDAQGGSASADSGTFAPSRTTCTLEGTFGLSDLNDLPSRFALVRVTCSKSKRRPKKRTPKSCLSAP